MNFGLAFNDTINHFSLKVTEIAQKSAVHRSVINRFKKGSQPIKTDNMEKLVEALDDKEFIFWIARIVDYRHAIKAIDVNALKEIAECFEEKEVVRELASIAIALLLKVEKRRT